jgi:sporulation protein YlmC with PRC-barrel domain
MLRTKKVTESYDMRVFTDTGDYFGDIEEVILSQTKIVGWRVKASRNSVLAKLLGNAKGVVVPHQLVKSVGDVMIISKAAMPSYTGEEPVA